MSYRRITVLGDGGWGTALAIVALKAGARVTLWGAFPDYVAEQARTRENPRFLPGVKIPDAIAYEADLSAAVADADLALSVIPTPFLRSVMERLRAAGAPRIPFCSCSKGMEKKTLLRPSQILRATLGARLPLAVLSGPSHAEEVARGLPCSVAVASPVRELATRIQRALSGPTFRIYTNPDPIGVELGGVLKNVIAVAGGICDGLALGDNAKAALITRGLSELARIGVALGARAKTFMGLAGLGDLITTCCSPHGRNRHVGEQLGRGKRIDEILACMQAVPEGVHSVESVRTMARRHKVDAPITEAVYRIVHDGAEPGPAVAALMTRKLTGE